MVLFDPVLDFGSDPFQQLVVRQGLGEGQNLLACRLVVRFGIEEQPQCQRVDDHPHHFEVQQRQVENRRFERSPKMK